MKGHIQQRGKNSWRLKFELFVREVATPITELLSGHHNYGLDLHK